MPTYEFLCQKCKKVFELTCSIAEYERKKNRVKCSRCGSTRVVMRISPFLVQTSKKS